MIASNVSSEAIVKALAWVNDPARYDDNVKIQQDGITSLNRNGTRLRFRLAVKDSKRLGHTVGLALARITGRKPRRLPHACWHVHGAFFDALLAECPGAVIRARRRRITKDGGNWTDYNVGSQLVPTYASESCDCGGEK